MFKKKKKNTQNYFFIATILPSFFPNCISFQPFAQWKTNLTCSIWRLCRTRRGPGNTVALRMWARTSESCRRWWEQSRSPCRGHRPAFRSGGSASPSFSAWWKTQRARLMTLIGAICHNDLRPHGGTVDKGDVRRRDETTSSFYSSCSCTLAAWDADLNDKIFWLISDGFSALSFGSFTDLPLGRIIGTIQIWLWNRSNRSQTIMRRNVD